MINQGAAYGNSALAVLLAFSCGGIFFYLLYLEGYRSGPRGALAKIKLLLGFLSAVFIVQGSLLIIGEFLASNYSNSRLNEDKIFSGVLFMLPAIVLSLVAWIVGLFQVNNGNHSSTEGVTSIKSTLTVDEQLGRNDMVMYGSIATVIILFVIVPNWKEFASIFNPAAQAVRESLVPKGNSTASNSAWRDAASMSNSKTLQSPVNRDTVKSFTPREGECVIEALSGSISLWSGNKRDGYVFYEVQFFEDRFLIYDLTNLSDNQVYAKIAVRQDQIKRVCAFK
jgi:hypothetical protein